MKTIKNVMMLLASMFISLGSAEANLVSNPSFEAFTGSFAPDGAAQLLPGTTELTGWSVVNNEIAVLTTPNNWDLTPSDGNLFVDLTGRTSAGFPKGISQLLTGLTVGQAYSFSMDLGVSNDTCPNCGGPIEVEANIGGTSQVFLHNSSDPGDVWAAFGFDFTADSTSMTLEILGISVPPGNIYIGLDNVAVSQVPLPPAVWLFGSGLLGLVGIARSKKA
jgi:hypothetical protein